MTTKPTTVDEYIATFPEATQQVLTSIRQIIRDIAPDVSESISYQIPAFHLHSKPLIHLAGWKHHIALYPFTLTGDVDLDALLEPYRAAKHTVRFPLKSQVPYALIEQYLQHLVTARNALG